MVPDVVKEHIARLPKRPDGTADFTNSKSATVINCFILFENKLLIVKRSAEVSTYQGKWNCVAGYLDDETPLEEKARGEIQEELSLDITSPIKCAPPFVFTDPLTKKWIVFPVIIELSEIPTITLDWEHTEYKWIDPRKLSTYDTVPLLADVFEFAQNHTE